MLNDCILVITLEDNNFLDFKFNSKFNDDNNSDFYSDNTEINLDDLSEIRVSVKSFDYLKLFFNKPLSFLRYINPIFSEVFADSFLDVCNLVLQNISLLKTVFVPSDNHIDIDNCISFMIDKCSLLDFKNLSLEKVVQILNSYEFNDEITFNTKYNYMDTSTFDEITDFISYLYTISDYVKYFNLSPFETCIFVNDLLKERKYVKSSVVDMSDARSISKVYKGTEIVCAGFSNMYSAILDLVGIKSECVAYYPDGDGDIGHMANIVYISDDKYGIDGFFEVDTTWGRKYIDGEYDYKSSINNYYHFANSIDRAYQIKQNSKLTPEYSFFNNLERGCSLCDERLNGLSFLMISNLQNIKKNLLKISNLYNVDYSDILNRINLVLDNHDIDFDTFEEIIDEVKFLVLECDFDRFTFTKALIHVRMIEQAIDKDKFYSSYDDCVNAVTTRFNSKIERLLFDLYAKKISDEELEAIERDFLRARFVSCLRKMSDNSLESNPFLNVMHNKKVRKID